MNKHLALLIIFYLANLSITFSQSVEFVLKDATTNENLVDAFIFMTDLNSNREYLISQAKSDEKYQAELEETSFPNMYSITIQAIGYDNLIDTVEVITGKNSYSYLLKDLNIDLEEINVVAKKNHFKAEDDKLVYNVGADETAKGKDILGLLKKMPGVQVMGESISILGDENVSVIMNGKKMLIPQDQINSWIKTLKSDRIDKIEVILNPSPKYGVSGSSIINIKTKKKNEGFKISPDISVGKGIYWRYKANISLSAGTEKMGIHLNLHGEDKDNETISLTHTNFDIIDVALSGTSKTLHHDLSKGVRGGVYYSINPKTYLSLSTDHFYRGMLNEFDGNTNIFPENRDWTTQSENQVNSELHQYNIDLTNTFDTGELSISADYAEYKSTTNYTANFMSNNTIDELISLSPLNVDLLGVDVNYNYNFKNSKPLEMGIKYVNSVTESSLNNERSNIFQTAYTSFLLREKTYSAFVSKKFSFTQTNRDQKEEKNNKISMEVGARVDMTQLNTESNIESYVFDTDYLTFLPFLSMSIPIKNNKLVLSYSTSIARPSYERLSPIVNYRDPFSLSTNNPYLLPTYLTTARLGYKFFWKTINTSINLGAKYEYYKNRVEPIISQSSIDTTANNLMININKNEYYKLYFILNKDLLKNWSVSATLSPYLIRYKNASDDYGDYDKNKAVFLFSLKNRIQLKSFNIDISTFARTGSLNGLYELSSLNSTDISIDKAFNNGKGKIGIEVSDVFNQFSYAFDAKYENVDSGYSIDRDTRVVSLILSYSFGLNKHKRKKTKSSIGEELRRTK